MIRIDRRSLKKAIHDAKFPRDMNISQLERDVERDMIEALKIQGIHDGTFKASLGNINYDVFIDKYGRRKIRHIKKR